MPGFNKYFGNEVIVEVEVCIFLFSVNLSHFFLQFNVSRMSNSNQGMYSASEVIRGWGILLMLSYSWGRRD